MSPRLISRIPIWRSLTRLNVRARPLLPLTQRITALNTLPRHGLMSRWSIPSRSYTTPPPSPSTSSSESPIPENVTVSQRLKILIKKYGWYALSMYIILSTADFAVAFTAVNLIGAEHVSHYTVMLKQFITSLIYRESPTEPTPGKEPAQAGHEGLYAMLILAYTVHKTLFLPVRVGLTAAFTPRFVGWLQRKGWAGRQGAQKALQDMKDRTKRRSSSSSQM